MPDILHRISIDADTERVRELVSTKQGVEDWWSAHPSGGTDRLGGNMVIFFGGANRQQSWKSSRTPRSASSGAVSKDRRLGRDRDQFRLDRRADGGTTLLFTHACWRESSDFMAHCSINWSAYLTSLKKGAEGEAFTPFPAGEVSRWS